MEKRPGSKRGGSRPDSSEETTARLRSKKNKKNIRFLLAFATAGNARNRKIGNLFRMTFNREFNFQGSEPIMPRHEKTVPTLSSSKRRHICLQNFKRRSCVSSNRSSALRKKKKLQKNDKKNKKKTKTLRIPLPLSNLLSSKKKRRQPLL